MQETVERQKTLQREAAQIESLKFRSETNLEGMRDAGALAREIGGVQKEISEHLSQHDESLLVIE